MNYLFISLLVMEMCGCTLLKKDEGSDEMEKMGETVLKSREGLEIDFKPIPLDKK